jgi:hypothetical protein
MQVFKRNRLVGLGPDIIFDFRDPAVFRENIFGLSVTGRIGICNTGFANEDLHLGKVERR